jgi:uncharacterized protein GlcG (DUF336 family)
VALPSPYGSPISLATFKIVMEAAENEAQRNQDMVAGEGLGLRVLDLPNVAPLEGGILLLRDGEIVGAIGASGMQAAQDAQVARAGWNALSRAPK